MIFAEEGVKLEGIENYMDRYSTREEALKGHECACAWVQGLIDGHRTLALAQALEGGHD